MELFPESLDPVAPRMDKLVATTRPVGGCLPATSGSGGQEFNLLGSTFLDGATGTGRKVTNSLSTFDALGTVVTGNPAPKPGHHIIFDSLNAFCPSYGT